MLILNEEALKNLQEIQFGAGQGEEDEQPDDYSVPEDDAAPTDEEGTDEGGEEPTTEDTEDTGEENTGEEEPPADEEETTEEDTEDTGDDYTMDEEPTDEGGEEDTTADEGEGEETPTDEEEDPTASATSMAKKKRLLSLYKKFYNDLMSLSTNIGERIAPLNSQEEYLYKIIIENIEKNKKLMYEYIETLYNTKDYEENIYQFYYFSSQVEMIHILLRKIKTYRDNLKNNIIKK